MHETERRVPRLESLRALEEADDLAVLGMRWHPVPESRREGRRFGFDDGVELVAYADARAELKLVELTRGRRMLPYAETLMPRWKKLTADSRKGSVNKYRQNWLNLLSK